MSYASRSGRAKTDPNNPKAFAVCDRCGRWWNHCDLKYQMAYRGNALVSTGFLVCRICYDVPFQLNRPLILPPDPQPIRNPRPEPFMVDEQNPPSFDIGPEGEPPPGNWDGGGHWGA